MKLLPAIVFLFFITITNAQDCRQHALLKEGTELEYKVTLPYDLRMPGEARILLTVVNVTDSAGFTYSRLLKQGGGKKNEKYRYKRYMDLQCDGKYLKLPYDFIRTDILWWSDISPTGRKKIIYSTVDPIGDENFTYQVPLSFEGVTSMPDPPIKTVKQISHTGGQTIEGNWKILSIKVAGKETITTPAGSFDCLKVVIETDVSTPIAFKNTMIYYYNSEVGLVRSNPEAQLNHSSTELVRVKK